MKTELTHQQAEAIRSAAVYLINLAREASAQATDSAGAPAAAERRAEAMAMEAGALALGLLHRIDARPYDVASLEDFVELIALACAQSATYRERNRQPLA